ncbi:MAG: phosphoglycerate mutase family protein [Cyanobacteria bacterium P01_F01_bin.53]
MPTSITPLRPTKSSTQASTATKRGTAYFIRHGESTFNERNIFAGVVDAELTAFGKMQARQAGQDIRPYRKLER